MAYPNFRKDESQNDVVDSMKAFGLSFGFFFLIGVIATIIEYMIE
ncbi:hypothetical protein BSNK01_05770 [Bacillaceae bacterium]